MRFVLLLIFLARTVTALPALAQETTVYPGGIDRMSSSDTTFNIQNSGTGRMVLQVDGDTVVTEGNVLRPENILWVAKSGAPFSSVQAAIDSISNAAGFNPYLVRVGPGVFDETVELKPFVRLEGSGIGITTLSYDFGQLNLAYVVTMAPYSQLANLTVSGIGENPKGIKTGDNTSSGDRTIDKVAIELQGSASAYGVAADMAPVASNTRILIKDVSIDLNCQSCFSLTGLVALVRGDNDVAVLQGIRVSIDGPTTGNGLVTGIEASWAVVASDIEVRVVAPGSSGWVRGIHTGGYPNTPRHFPSWQDVSVTVEGGTGNSAAVYVDSDKTTFENLTTSTIDSQSGQHYGVYLTDRQTEVAIRNSVVRGSSAAMPDDFQWGTIQPNSVALFSSVVEGGITIDPAKIEVKCFGVADGNLDPLDATCQ